MSIDSGMDQSFLYTPQRYVFLWSCLDKKGFEWERNKVKNEILHVLVFLCSLLTMNSQLCFDLLWYLNWTFVNSFRLLWFQTILLLYILSIQGFKKEQEMHQSALLDIVRVIESIRYLFWCTKGAKVHHLSILQKIITFLKNEEQMTSPFLDSFFIVSDLKNAINVFSRHRELWYR